MKTRTAKTGLLVLALASGLALSSFTILKNTPAAAENVAASSRTNWEDYNKVRTFAYERICIPLNKSNTKLKVSAFSRCPSGHEANIAGKADSVKIDQFVYGEINLFRGCSPKYVCDFKVNVKKGIAQVKAKGDTDYMEVKDWIAGKNQPAPVQETLPKQKSTEIKG